MIQKHETLGPQLLDMGLGLQCNPNPNLSDKHCFDPIPYFLIPGIEKLI
jgi:hypothetical protein